VNVSGRVLEVMYARTVSPAVRHMHTK